VAGDAYDEFLTTAAPDTGGIRKLISDLGITCNNWKANPWPLDDSLHPTAWVVSQSRRVLEDTADDQPLFMTTSFYAPHPPLFPPKTYFTKYLNKTLPTPAHGDWVDWASLSPEGDGAGHRILLQGEVLQASQAGYFGLIEHLDDQIGPLIREFKARSETAGRPWVILVTSDHGEMLGDHGYFRKCEPFEGSANIPFIIAGSRGLGFKPGQRVTQPVCLEDIMPTLLTLAGAAIPAQVDGVSLVPALTGSDQETRPWLHFEHAPCYSQAQAYHALTDGRLKYIWRPADGREHLFDLESDPEEERDLTRDSAFGAVLETWRARLVRRLAERPEGFSRDGKLIPGCTYKPLNPGTLNL
jgi:arylsulfatase A-like enzyme